MLEIQLKVLEILSWQDRNIFGLTLKEEELFLEIPLLLRSVEYSMCAPLEPLSQLGSHMPPAGARI